MLVPCVCVCVCVYVCNEPIGRDKMDLLVTAGVYSVLFKVFLYQKM